MGIDFPSGSPHGMVNSKVRHLQLFSRVEQKIGRIQVAMDQTKFMMSVIERGTDLMDPKVDIIFGKTLVRTIEFPGSQGPPINVLCCDSGYFMLANKMINASD